MSEEPTESAVVLERALDERAELLDRKDVVLAAFRRAHESLTNRRDRDYGHQPERRTGG